MRMQPIAFLFALTFAAGCSATRTTAVRDTGTASPATGDPAAGEPGIAIEAFVVDLPRALIRSMLTEHDLAGSTRDALFVETIRELAQADRGVEILMQSQLGVHDGGDIEVSLVNPESYTKGYGTDAEGLPERLTGIVEEGLWFAANPCSLPDGAIRLGYTLTKRSIQRPIPEKEVTHVKTGGTVTLQLPEVDTQRVEGEPVLRPGECWVVGLIALGPLGIEDPERATLVLLTPSVTTLPLEAGLRVVPERAALEAAAAR